MQGVSYSRLDSPAEDEQGLIKLRREGNLSFIYILCAVSYHAGQGDLPAGLGDVSTSNLDRVSKYYLDYCK
jgi:hypothetical protein